MAKKILYGLLNADLEEVIAPTFRTIYDFSEGLAAAKKSNRWGYINHEGEWVIKPKFSYAGDFSGGIAEVEEDGVYGLINKNGEYILKPHYKEIRIHPSGSIALVQDERVHGYCSDTKYGLINSEGRWLTEIEYGGHTCVNIGWALQKNDDWRIFDKDGNIFANEVFGNVQNCSEGIALVSREIGYKLEKDYCYVDNTGRTIAEVAWGTSFINGVAGVKDKKTWSWGIMDKEGKWVLEPQFDFMHDFCEDIAPYGQDGLIGYVRADGKILTEPLYKAYSKFSGGYASVPTEKGVGIINNQGEPVTEQDYKSAFVVGNDMVALKRDEYFKIVNLKTKKSIERNYIRLGALSDGLIIFGVEC